MTHEEAITEITRRLVEFYQPERVYLFGSTARGERTANSDLDFLVLIPDEAPVELLRGTGLSRVLAGIPLAVDVIPWRRSDFDGRAAHVVASLPATVVREGRLVYDAARAAA
jgi:predicted nucleotidyltransferase